jgi:ubiquinone/menaquinone biosynthesis C-methylase UbiE
MLDVGTGTAIFAEAFARKGLRVAGIDINGAMIAEAKRLLPEGEFKVGSMEKIPYDNASFDIVFLGHVLHETDDTAKALSEARRTARMRVVVLEWPYIEEQAGPPLGHRLKPEEIMTSAKRAGFEIIESMRLKHMVLYRMETVYSTETV